MLRVAKKRVATKKGNVAPIKPVAPPAWVYPQEFVATFFWKWVNADYDPMLTPDGRPFDEQDPEFWALVNYLKDLYDWAEYKAEHPAPMSALPGLTMEDL